MIVSVFIASFAQILLKKGARKINIYINRYTISAYFFMLISTICSYIGYYKIDLAMSGALQTLSFVFVPVLGFFLLKERINKKTIVGIILIIIGTIIYCLF